MVQESDVLYVELHGHCGTRARGTGPDHPEPHDASVQIEPVEFHVTACQTELTEVNTRRVACRRQVLQRRARCRTYRRRVHTGVFYRPAAPQWRAQSRCSRPALLWVSGRRCPRQWQPTAGAAPRRHRVQCSGVGTTGERAVIEVVSRAEVCEPARATHLACEKEVLNDAAQLRLQVVPKLVRSF
jgi:hypothetical protein